VTTILLRPSEAAAELGVSRSKFYALLREGKVPGVIRLGSQTRIVRAVLEAGLLEAATTQRTALEVVPRTVREEEPGNGPDHAA
jgi:excisionase family DNA binding protein